LLQDGIAWTVRPIQFGIPGGPELLIGFLVVAVIGAALAYYIYTDAEKRGEDNGALWAVVAGLASVVASPIGGLIVLFVYVLQRG
jgi:uncharacterized membrane protein YeaQ/YmgE (transglycosylase-associated protein family)